jgi:uncharacterized protein (TIGR02001 family)
MPEMRLVAAPLICVVGLAAPALAAAQDAAVGVNGYLTLGNGYWSHGLSQNDGFSLQLGVDYQHSSGFFTGGWAANVDYAVEYSQEQPRDVVADVYAGYHARAKDWSWTAVVGRYFYPGTAIRYDYDEVGATVGFRDRVYYTASYSPSFYAQGRSALNQELSLALPLRGDIELGATLGQFTIHDTNVDYTHWNVGVSKLIRRVVVDLRYYESGMDRTTWLGDPTANQYVISVSYALHGRRTRI